MLLCNLSFMEAGSSGELLVSHACVDEDEPSRMATGPDYALRLGNPWLLMSLLVDGVAVAGCTHAGTVDLDYRRTIHGVEKVKLEV